MTLPFRCEDCGATITLTTDEAVAIYAHRIALCQACITSMEEEREAYDQLRIECGFWNRSGEALGQPGEARP